VSENPTTPEQPAMSRDVILVGKKPIMSYAMAALMQLTGGNSVTIKARGAAISCAVDVAEVVVNRLLHGNAVIEDVAIGTVVLGEPPRNVSTIEIKVSSKPTAK